MSQQLKDTIAHIAKHWEDKTITNIKLLEKRISSSHE
jgi:hypothetical protein